MSQIRPDLVVKQGILKMKEFTQIQQVGIDLTISESVEIEHGQFKNVLLNEQVFLTENIFATFTHRSSFNRKGIFITGSIYDPGYCGQVGCSIYNLSGEDIVINVNERIGQMVFFEANASAKYEGQYQSEKL